MKVSEAFWFYLDDCLCDTVRFSCAPALAEIHRQMRPHWLTIKANQVEAMSDFLEDIAETEPGSIGTEAAKLAKNLRGQMKKFKTTPAAWALIEDHLKKIMENGHSFPDIARIQNHLDHSRRTFEVNPEDLAVFGIILTDLQDGLLDIIKRNWSDRHSAYRIKQIQTLLDLVALFNKLSTAY